MLSPGVDSPWVTLGASGVVLPGLGGVGAWAVWGALGWEELGWPGCGGCPGCGGWDWGLC